MIIISIVKSEFIGIIECPSLSKIFFNHTKIKILVHYSAMITHSLYRLIFWRKFKYQYFLVMKGKRCNRYILWYWDILDLVSIVKPNVCETIQTREITKLSNANIEWFTKLSLKEPTWTGWSSGTGTEEPLRCIAGPIPRGCMTADSCPGLSAVETGMLATESVSSVLTTPFILTAVKLRSEI